MTIEIEDVGSRRVSQKVGRDISLDIHRDYGIETGVVPAANSRSSLCDKTTIALSNLDLPKKP